MSSCSSPEIYHRYHDVPNGIWAHNDTLIYEVDSMHATQRCAVSLELRMGRGYPYRDLWVELEHRVNDSIVRVDRRSISPYNERDEFQASGFGSFYQYRELIYPSLTLPDSTAYTFRVRHVMKELYLKDIYQVGLRLEVNP